MAAMEDINKNTDLMIAVASMLEFYNDPPSQIFNSKYEGGIKRIYRKDDKINVFIQSPGYRAYFPNTCGSVIKVETYEELEEWTEKLQSKPSLVDVHCRRVSVTRDQSSEHLVRDGYFAAIINPNNPHMKNQIEKALDGARRAMKDGKRFILEFDVSSAIQEWFSEKVKDQVQCEYGKITVANTYIYEDIEDAFCSTTLDKVLWCGCYLGSSSIYALHRLILCQNITVTLSGITTQFSPHIDDAINSTEVIDQEPILRIPSLPPLDTTTATNNGKVDTPRSRSPSPVRPPTIGSENAQPSDTAQSSPSKPDTTNNNSPQETHSQPETKTSGTDATVADNQLDQAPETTEDDTANLVVYYV